MYQWPHSPAHRFTGAGTYFVTAGTYLKQHICVSQQSLDLVGDLLITLAAEHGWDLHAWALFSNHYHWVASFPQDDSPLREFVQHLHSEAARLLNRADGVEGRKVWYQYRDTELTNSKSYLARLAYTMGNPVKHGLVRVPTQYPWCSAGWFEKNASEATRKTVWSFKVDRVAVPDDYEVVAPDGFVA